MVFGEDGKEDNTKLMSGHAPLVGFRPEKRTLYVLFALQKLMVRITLLS